MKLPTGGQKLQNIKQMLSHPNALTIYRIIAVPAIVLLLIFPNRLSLFMAAILFSLAAITDFLDGFYARQMGLESDFGRIMDPLADKLLVSSTLIMISAFGWVPAWAVCLMIGRELAVTGLRNFIAGSSEDISASALGKYKTGFQIAAIIPLLIHHRYVGIDFQQIGEFFFWVALTLTVWSGIDYFIRFRKLLQA